MAEDTDVREQQGSGANTSGVSMPLLIALIVMPVITVGLFIVLAIVGTADNGKESSNGDKIEGATQELAEEDLSVDVKKTQTAMLSLPEVLVNVKGTQMSRYLKLKVVIEFPTKDQATIEKLIQMKNSVIKDKLIELSLIHI